MLPEMALADGSCNSRSQEAGRGPAGAILPQPGVPGEGAAGRGNIGVHSVAERRYVCRACGKTFAATKGTPFYRLRKGEGLVTVVLTLFDAVVPDLMYVAKERATRLESRFMRGAPDLVVEVLSPSTSRRDEGVKLELYSRHDVLEYWVVDPMKRRLRVYRRRGLKLARVRELPSTRIKSLTTPLLPGLSLQLETIVGR